MDQPQTQPPRDRRTLLVIAGAAVALLAGVVIAWSLASGGRGERTPPPASRAGLVIESSPVDGKLDTTRPLRCFVAGQFVGELSLADCARRNGVATDALDVGIDETGALAASEEAGLMLTPLPPEDAGTAEEPGVATEDEADQPTTGPLATCWRHSGGQWRKLPGEMDLNACVQTLFGGRCERPGQASYGRFGQQTLRLVTGRVEISSDNQSFRTLAAQRAGCSLPTAG